MLTWSALFDHFLAFEFFLQYSRSSISCFFCIPLFLLIKMLFAIGDNLSYGLNTLGPLCLWQCLENTSKTNLIRKIRNSHEAWNRGRPNRKTVDLEKLHILRHRKDKETIGFRIPNFLLEAAIQLWWREIAEELVMHRIQKCDWGENWK